MGEECKFRIEGTDGGLALSFHIEGPSKPVFETCAGTDMSLDITFIPLLAVSSGDLISMTQRISSQLISSSSHSSGRIQAFPDVVWQAY